LQRCHVHPGLTEQQAVRAKRSSKKRQTKPIEISHKSLAPRELTSDRFGPLYAKRTQFRGAITGIEGMAMPETGTQRSSAPRILDYARGWHAWGAEWDRQTRKLASACPPGFASRKAVRGVCGLSDAETNSPDLRIVQVLWKSRIERDSGSSTVRSAARLTPE